MESRKDLVDRAIAFKQPQRIPIVFWNCAADKGRPAASFRGRRGPLGEYSVSTYLP